VIACNCLDHFRLKKYCYSIVRQLQAQFIQPLDLDDRLATTLSDPEDIDNLSSNCVVSLANGAMVRKLIVEQQLTERAQAPASWSSCSVCGTLVNKGFVKRRILTLVGQVEWKRRVEDVLIIVQAAKVYLIISLELIPISKLPRNSAWDVWWLYFCL